MAERRALVRINGKMVLLPAGDTLVGAGSGGGNYVSYDAGQGLTSPQQIAARANIDAASATNVGDTDHDFVADFNAALA